MKNKVIHTTLFAALFGVTLSYQACSRSDTFTNKSSLDRNPSMSGGTTTDNPKPTVSVSIVNSGSNTSTNTQLCLGEIHFAGEGMTAATPPSGSTMTTASVMSNPYNTYSPYDYGMGNFYKMMGDTDQFMAQIMDYTMSLTGMYINLMPQGNFVKMVPLAPGSYTSIDLSLEHACAFGSLAVPTDSGVLNTSEPLVLHFVGSANLSQSDKVELNVGQILDALSKARNSSDVKAIVDSVNGTF